MSDIIPLSFDKDPLSQKPFCLKLEQFLIVEHDFVDGSLVVSLNAPFGAGKSTFLSMWKSDLESRRQENKELPIPITLNAWENDYCGDPLLAVVMALLKTVHKDAPVKEKKLRDAVTDAAWFGTGLANKFVEKWTGIDPVAAGEFAEKRKAADKKKKPDFITLYEERMEALANLKNTLSDIFNADSPKAFIFVDELDRCRPDYAISYLETIKHIFDVHGLVFVLALDYAQLGCSARALFGGDLNVPEYLRKFIQRSFSLPEPDEQGFQKLAHLYASHYLERNEKRISMLDLNNRVKHVGDLIGALKMTPRQIQETFRIIGHTASCKLELKGRLLWCLGVGLIFMSALKVMNSKLYREVGIAKEEHIDVCKYLIGIFGSEKARWWIFIYLTGVDLSDRKPQVDFEAIVRELGYIKKDDSFNPRFELGQFIEGWGMYSSGRFQHLYKSIENANTLA